MWQFASTTRTKFNFRNLSSPKESAKRIFFFFLFYKDLVSSKLPEAQESKSFIKPWKTSSNILSTMSICPNGFPGLDRGSGLMFALLARDGDSLIQVSLSLLKRRPWDFLPNRVWLIQLGVESIISGNSLDSQISQNPARSDGNYRERDRVRFSHPAESRKAFQPQLVRTLCTVPSSSAQTHLLLHFSALRRSPRSQPPWLLHPSLPPFLLFFMLHLHFLLLYLCLEPFSLLSASTWRSQPCRRTPIQNPICLSSKWLRLFWQPPPPERQSEHTSLWLRCRTRACKMPRRWPWILSSVCPTTSSLSLFFFPFSLHPAAFQIQLAAPGVWLHWLICPGERESLPTTWDVSCLNFPPFNVGKKKKKSQPQLSSRQPTSLMKTFSSLCTFPR